MDLLFRKNFIGDTQVYESQLYDAQSENPLVKSVGEQSQHSELNLHWKYVCASCGHAYCYRSGPVNSKLFVGNVLLQTKWKFELNYTL